MFPQNKPFRKLVHPHNYQNHAESFITSQNFVDKFFSMAKSNRDLGKTGSYLNTYTETCTLKHVSDVFNM